MRPGTQIDKPALPIEANLLVGRDFAYVFSLIALADLAKKGGCSIAVPHLPGNGLVAPDDFAHPRLDPLEVFRGERLGTGEVVIEPGIRRRAEGDLGIGIEFLDRLGHDMGGIVTEDLEPVGCVARDDRDRGVAVDDHREVARFTIDPDRDSSLREPRPDRRRNFTTSHRVREFAAAAVGQGHRDRAWRVALLRRNRGVWVVVGLLDHRALCSVVIGRSDGANWSRKTPSVGRRGHSG